MSVPGIDLLVTLVVLAGAAAMAGGVAVHYPLRMPSPWTLPVAVSVGALADLTLVNLRFGHNRYAFTWSEAFVILGLVLVPAPWLVLLAPAGVAVMHLLLRRPLKKVAFNAFGMAVGICLARGGYDLVAGHRQPTLSSSAHWLGLLVAACVLYLWNHGTVAAAVAFSQNLPFRDVALRGVPLSLVVWIGNTISGAGFVALYLVDHRAIAVLPIVLGFVFLLYKGYLKASQDAELWQLLQSVTRDLTQLDQESLAGAVVEAGTALFGAEFVELMIVDESQAGLVCLRQMGETASRFLTPADYPGELWLRAQNERELFLVTTTASSDVEREELERLGLSSCMVSPLVVSERCLGMLRLGFRGEVRMSQRETQVLSTFANQVTTSLWNAQLFQQTTQLSEQSRAITESLGEGVVAIDNDGRVTFANPAAAAMVGLALEDLAGRTVHDVLHGAEGVIHPPEVRCRLLDVLEEGHTVRYDDQSILHARAGMVPVAFTAAPIRHGERVLGAVIALRDMTERRALEAQLTYQAFHDPTTDVANRSLFIDRLQHVMSKRSLSKVAVLFVDLDRFKVVNDSLGHRAGDALLRQVAQRVSGCLRPADTLARWGGDEFTVLLESVDDESEAVAVAERILSSMSRPFPALGRDVVLSVSVGIALGRPLASDPQQMIHDADVAMYRAKSRGRDTLAVFRPEMGDQPLERLELESGLRRGLEAGEFQAYYQPVVAIGSGRIRGVEALVRWNSPTGLLGPASFIGLAEETGLILPLGLQVLEQACRQVRQWQIDHPELDPVLLSVNLSARQFQDGQLARTVADVLGETGLDPRYLCLEITETVVMQDVPSTLTTLNELKALGVQLAIDDFGTGYSSLSYLKRFPVDAVKIDRSFVEGLGQHAVDTEIVAAVVRLARSLGMRTVAEGVETEAQLEKLRELGCPLVQGFYYSPAQTAERIEAMLTAQLETSV